MLKTLEYEIKSASKIQSPLQLIAEARPAYERKDEEDNAKRGNAVRKAKEVRGYYSDDDIKILSDALFNKIGIKRAGELRDKEDGTFIANIFVGGRKKTIVLTTIVEGEEDINGRITQLKKELVAAYNKRIDQILIPTNRCVSHWYSLKLSLFYYGNRINKVEWCLHDSLYKRSKETLIHISHSLEATILTSFGISKEQLMGQLSTLPLIQRGISGAVNHYCGGYMARLIANLIMDPRMDRHGSIEAWGCLHNKDSVLRQEDVMTVDQYNSYNSGNFGAKPMYASEAIVRAQEASLLRNFIANGKSRQIIQELKRVYEDIPVEIKTLITSLNIPKDPSILSATVRDLYTGLPLLKGLFQINAEGEIERDIDGQFKIDATIEMGQVYHIMIGFKRTCLELEGVEVKEDEKPELGNQIKPEESKPHNRVNKYDLLNTKPSNYPNDLVHGLLIAHCVDEVESHAGSIKLGSAVKLSPDNELCIRFGNTGADLNAYLSDWSVQDVIENSPTGYLGVIYLNKKEQRVILVHSSINFALGFTAEYLFKQPGSHVENALMEVIVTHQAYAYLATKRAVDYAKELRLILSITGHSLGGWLAELSVFYCNINLKYKNVKGVTFDSPGSFEAIEKMRALNAHETVSSFEVGELDIVSYLSAPNCINSASKHIGTVYRVFPEIEHIAPNWLAKVTGDDGIDATLSTIGHDLRYLLPYFDINTGVPTKCRQVQRWPYLVYKGGKEFSEHLWHKPVDKLEDLYAKIGKRGKRALSKLIGKEPSILGSLVYIIRDFANEKIKECKFWEVHKYLDKSYDFDDALQIRADEFWVLYSGNYLTDEADRYSRSGSDVVDKWMKKLKQSEQEIIHSPLKIDFIDQVKFYLDTYDYNPASNLLSSKGGHSVVDLRDNMRILLHRYERELAAFVSMITGYKIVHYLGNEEANDINFIGRVEELKTIQEKLESVNLLLITGEAGVGKTTIARRYAQTAEGYIPIWFNTNSKMSLARSYREFGESLNLALYKLEDSMVMNIIHNKISSSAQKILFIFDDLEGDYAKDYLQDLPNNVKLLITISHDSKLTLAGDEMYITPFTQEEACVYLQDNGMRQESVELLIEEIGTIPQHLSLVAGYLKNEGANQAYLKKGIIFEVIISEIAKNHETAWKLLQYVAWLDSAFVPEEALSELVSNDAQELWSAIEELEKRFLVSIVKKDDNELGLKLHRNVQNEIALYVNKYPNQSKDPAQVVARILQVLNRLLPEITNSPNEGWIKAALYVSNVETILKLMDSRNINLASGIDIAMLNLKLGIIYTEMFVDLSSALYHKERALKIMQLLYSDNNSDVATAFSSIGVAYQKLENPGKGILYLDYATKIRKALYKSNHPDVATSLSDLGNAHVALGYVKLGRQYFNQALKIRQALYLGAQSDIAESLSNMGIVYEKSGDMSRAIMYYKQALDMRRALYSGYHPDVASSLNLIGVAYEKLGSLKIGLNYKERALHMRQALYLGDHPDIAISLNEVGVTYDKLGDVKNGLSYYQQALKIRLVLYKSNHPDVAQSLNNIGTAYELLGDVKNALSHHKQALNIRQTFYKDNHPYIAESLNNLGNAYQVYGYTSCALDYQEQALKMRQSLYLDAHPDVVSSLNNVGVAYYKLGDVGNGLIYQEQALSMMKAIYPNNHLYVVISFNNIAVVYKALGDIGKYTICLKQADSHAGFVSKRGSINHDILRIRQKIQKTLNKIQALSAKGVWSNKYVGVDYGVFGYLKEIYLIKLLGATSNTKILSIASSLCFEAINIGIANSGSQNLVCAIEFAKFYPHLISVIAKKHPEYFVTETIARACLSVEEYGVMAGSPTKTSQQSRLEEFKGEGSLSYAIDGYPEYYNSGIDQILKLRLDRVGLISNSNTILLKSRYLTKDLSSSVGKLANDVSVKFSTGNTRIIITPVNLHNKHWAGLLFRNLGSLVEIIYIDSEQTTIVPWIKQELEYRLSMNGYENRFLELKLEKQRYNNCGSELVENFIYYLTGTRATQEGAVYLHSLLMENTLLDPEEYSLQLQENNKLIGFLSNSEPIVVREVLLFSEQEYGVEEWLVLKLKTIELECQSTGSFVACFGLGIEVFCKKLLYRKELSRFTSMVEEYDIELPDGLTAFDVLLDNGRFNKLVMNRIHPDKNPFGVDVGHEDTLFVRELRSKVAADLNVKQLLDDSITKVNSVLHKTSIGFKALDLVVDSARLAYEPTTLHAKKLLLDYAYLHGMIAGVNRYSIMISGAEVAYQLHRGEYHEAFNIAADTLHSMALPFILAQTNKPYLSFVYGVWIAAATAYNAIENAYSFVLELASENASLKSAKAYNELAEWLAASPIQSVYDFEAYAKEYKLLINDILFEKEKLVIQSQLEVKGEFGKKVFDYIYLPALTEKYTLLGDIINGALTTKEAETLKTRPIVITSHYRSYDHCMAAKDIENRNDTDSRHYYCYNDKQQILELILMGSDQNFFEVLERL